MKDPRELLATLVACPSVSGAEQAIASLASDVARDMGLAVTRVGDNVVAHAGPELERVRLLLCSHLDTVPVGEGWTRDPHGARWLGGKLFGRGANDAKASGAAMLWALAECAREERAGGVAVALTVREETDNSGVEAVLAELGPPEMAVIGEPTGLEVVRSQGGLAVLEAHWLGSSCHAAHAARVAHDSALIRAARELADLGPFAKLGPAHPLLGWTTIVPSIFRSGERHNVVPDRASAVFDCRLAPPVDAASCAEHLRAVLPTASVRVRSRRLLPIETAADHPLVTTALEILGKPAATGSNTLSDMALLTGVAAIKCGPGETARSHTPDEFVTEDELRAGCRFYRSLVRALAAGPARSSVARSSVARSSVATSSVATPSTGTPSTGTP